MEQRKNHATVVKAIGELRGDGLPVAYVCGSDGEERDQLLRLAKQLGLQQWVRFTGTVSDEEKLLTYRASDIYAMPSIQCGEMIEGFGIVFVEAAASGIPSISGNVGGQAEAVLDGRTGLVVDGESLTQVKEAIRALVTDGSVRERMGKEGRRWAAEHDWDKVVEKTWRAIQRLRPHRVR
jgi:phosphatidylinositol alpha-1,6-mannosyltransferase